MEIILSLLATLSSISIVTNCDGYSARYGHPMKTIEICEEVVKEGKLMHAVLHELGHHYRYTVMTNDEHKEYRKVWETDLNYVTKYAQINIEESFAEMFYYVASGQRVLKKGEKYEFVKEIFD